MNVKRFLIGCVVTCVVVQALGILIGLFWLPVAYENHVNSLIPLSLGHVRVLTTISTYMIYGAVSAVIYRPVEE